MQLYNDANHSFDGKSSINSGTKNDIKADSLAKVRTINFLKPYLGL